MSIQSRITRGIGFGALSVAMLGFAPTGAPPSPVYEVNPYYGHIHGGGGADNGQPIPYDWRSIDDLFKTNPQQRAMLMADDEMILAAIMAAVTEELI